VVEEATVYFRRQALTLVSAKRQSDSVPGSGVSDHWVGARESYAEDWSNGPRENAHMEAAARQVCRHFGITYRKNSYSCVGNVQRGRRRFRVQVIYGARVDHGDHVHLGVRAL
jgi:hypothetical protein